MKASLCCNALSSYLEDVEGIENPHSVYSSPVILGFRLCPLRHVDTAQEHVGIQGTDFGLEERPIRHQQVLCLQQNVHFVGLFPVI